MHDRGLQFRHRCRHRISGEAFRLKSRASLIAKSCLLSKACLALLDDVARSAPSQECILCLYRGLVLLVYVQLNSSHLYNASSA